MPSIQSDQSSVPDDRTVIFLDIDNTLYSKKAGVNELMVNYIKDYIKNTLNLDDESAEMLHNHYYRDYGLAIEGLVRVNHINALEYNAKVDDALPLDDIIKPDPAVTEFLESFDKSKVKLWLFTNAYINHARRIIDLMKLNHIFDGVTYCDYAEANLICKPKPEMYEKAMREAGVTDVRKCYYVDDSALNVAAAMEFGWFHTVHFCESWECPPVVKPGHDSVASLPQLKQLYPKEFFKS